MSAGTRWRLAVAAIAAGWGTVALIVDRVDLPAAAIALHRVAIAAAAVIVWAAVTRRLDVLRPAGHGRGLVLVGALLGVHWLAYFTTIKLSSVTLAVLLAYTGPPLVAVLAPRLTGARTRPAAWLALAAGAAGAATVAVGGGDRLHVGPAAIATGLVTGATFALLLLTSTRLAPRVPAPAFLAWEMATATVVVLPVALVGPVVPPDAASAAGVIVLGLGCTAGLIGAFIVALRHVEAQSVAVLTYVEPVSSVLLAWVLLGEDPSRLTALGVLLVVAAGVATVGLGAGAPERRHEAVSAAVGARGPAATLRR